MKKMPEYSTSQKLILITIHLLPEVEDDLDALAVIGDEKDRLKSEGKVLRDYQVVEGDLEEVREDGYTRGGGETLYVVSNLFQILHDQQEVIKLLIGAGTTILAMLLKQRHLKKIEIKLGEKSLQIEDVDRKAAQSYLELFAEICKEENAATTARHKLEIKAHLAGQAALEESTSVSGQNV